MAQVFLDRISATHHVESVVATEEISNGQFLKLGKLDADGERRLVTKATGNADANVFLVDAPVSYGDPHFDIAKYVLPVGATGRAYHKEEGAIVSVTKDLVGGGAKVGDALDVASNGLGFTKASGNGIAMLIGEENHGFDGDVYVVAFN